MNASRETLTHLISTLADGLACAGTRVWDTPVAAAGMVADRTEDALGVRLSIAAATPERATNIPAVIQMSRYNGPLGRAIAKREAAAAASGKRSSSPCLHKAVTNARPWAGADFWLAECIECGSSIAVPAPAKDKP